MVATSGPTLGPTLADRRIGVCINVPQRNVTYYTYAYVRMYVCTYAYMYARRAYIVRTHVLKHETRAILLCYRECAVSYVCVFLFVHGIVHIMFT